VNVVVAWFSFFWRFLFLQLFFFFARFLCPFVLFGCCFFGVVVFCPVLLNFGCLSFFCSFVRAVYVWSFSVFLLHRLLCGVWSATGCFSGQLI